VTKLPPSQWKPGTVAWFYKLHEDTARKDGEDIKNEKLDGTSEVIRLFAVKGKRRPCLVLSIRPTDRYFRVWYVTSSLEGDCEKIPLKLQGLSITSHLHKNPVHMRWTHCALSDEWINQLDDAILKGFLEAATAL
jgi:hypothetical protein